MSKAMHKPWVRRAGTALMVLVTALLAVDAGMKVTGAQAAIDATGELGFPASATRALGLLLAIATGLFVLPVTRVLGAILLTGYLGGSVAVHVLHGSPISTHALFGAYVGVAVWGSIWLGNDRIRELLPFEWSSR